MRTTVDRFGRVLIPKKSREGAGWKSGDVLEVITSADGVELRRASVEGVVVLRNGVPVYRGVLPESSADLVARTREERHRELLRRSWFASPGGPGPSATVEASDLPVAVSEVAEPGPEPAPGPVSRRRRPRR